MKFTDLSPAKQQLLKAYISGETIEYFSDVFQTWRVTTSTLETLEALNDKNLRVKPKEPETTYKYHAIGLDGHLYSATESTSIKNLKEYYANSKLHSFVKRTYHDGKFIKAEIVQE